MEDQYGEDILMMKTSNLSMNNFAFAWLMLDPIPMEVSFLLQQSRRAGWMEDMLFLEK